MKYILYFLLSMSFLGCSGRGLENAIENGMVALSGNKPPSFFKIANTQTMRDYVFNVKDATFLLPSANEKDFTTMGGWEGSTHYNKDVVLYLDKGLGVSYHIHITSSIYPYTERERELLRMEMLRILIVFTINIIQTKMYHFKGMVKKIILAKLCQLQEIYILMQIERSHRLDVINSTQIVQWSKQ